MSKKLASVGRRTHLLPRLSSLEYPVGIPAVTLCKTIILVEEVDPDEEVPFCRECLETELAIQQERANMYTDLAAEIYGELYG